MLFWAHSHGDDLAWRWLRFVHFISKGDILLRWALLRWGWCSSFCLWWRLTRGNVYLRLWFTWWIILCIHCLTKLSVFFCLFDPLMEPLEILELVSHTIIKTFDGNSIGVQFGDGQSKPCIILDLNEGQQLFKQLWWQCEIIWI